MSFFCQRSLKMPTEDLDRLYQRQHSSVAIFKVCLSGKYGTGKTSIFKIVSKKPQDGAAGIDSFKYPCQNLGIEGAEILLYDTAGREEYTSSLTISNYYRDAHAIVFVYDVKEMESLTYIENELRRIQERGRCDKSRIVLIRNKSDVPSTRVEVSHEKEDEFLQNRATLFQNLVHRVEVSALETPGAITKLFYEDLGLILKGQTPTGYVNIFESFKKKTSSRKSNCC